MVSTTQSTKVSGQHKVVRSSHDEAGSIWASLAYGGGMLLVSLGPIWAGMKVMVWMAVFLGVNTGVLIAACLLGAWRNLNPIRSPRRLR